MMRADGLIALVAAWSLAGCAASVPPRVSADQGPRLDDEVRLWNRCGEEQERLFSSGWVLKDSVALQYVGRVMERLASSSGAPPDVASRLVLLRDPSLNAFAYPNGVICLHIGILSRVEHEDELATLLAHEWSHVVHRHTIRHIRSTRSTVDALAVLNVALMPLGVIGGLVSSLGSIGGMASVSGYSRDLESEADLQGLHMMRSAGYPLERAERLFEHLQTSLKEEEITEPFFFASHPHLNDRIEMVKRLRSRIPPAERKPDVGDPTEAFRELTFLTADLDLARGRYKAAARGIDRLLSRDPGHVKALHLRAELLRWRSDPGDLATADSLCNVVASADANFAPVHRTRGLLALKRGERKVAAEHFRRYLALDPRANDRAYIEQYINEEER